MRLVLPREASAPQQQPVDPQASSAISFRAHRTRGEEDQARSLPDSSPAFTSDAAARGLISSYEEGVAAAGSRGERAACGRGQWWHQEEQRAAERRGSECGAARSSHSPKVQENENRWLEEDERANSEDECEAGGPSNSTRRRELTEQELFELLHRTKGFKVKNMEPDGNCLFHAISDQIYGDPGMHEEVYP